MIIVDVEASGVDYNKHSIISLGAIDFDHPENQLYEECRIWDGAHIDAGASEVHGMSDAAITDPTKQSEADLVHKFIAFAEPICRLGAIGSCGERSSYRRRIKSRKQIRY